MENEDNSTGMVQTENSHPLKGVFSAQAKWAGNLSALVLILIIGTFLYSAYKVLSFPGNQIEIIKIFLILTGILFLFWICYINLYKSTKSLKLFESTDDESFLDTYAGKIQWYFILYAIIISAMLAYGLYSIVNKVMEM